MSDELNVNFGKPNNDYDKNLDIGEDDDLELERTPEDVVKMLGFDPKELNNQEKPKMIKVFNNAETT